MKRFILPLLILLFVGSLFAVESAPSEVVGYVKYDCPAGNNLLALPMVQAITTTTEFGALFGEDINTINLYNAAIQDWEASVNYGDGFWDPDYDVSTGTVLFINATNPITFYSIGALPEMNAQYSIVSGNNTIMIPLNKSDLSYTSFAGASMSDGETVNTINLFNPAIQDWEASVNYGDGFWDPDYELTIGTPLFINSGSDFTWPEGPRVYNSLFGTNKK